MEEEIATFSPRPLTESLALRKINLKNRKIKLKKQVNKKTGKSYKKTGIHRQETNLKRHEYHTQTNRTANPKETGIEYKPPKNEKIG